MRKASLMLDNHNCNIPRERAVSHTFGLKLDCDDKVMAEAKEVIEESHKDISQISLKNSELPHNNLHLNLKS